jgi:hypothetical protein
MHIYFVHEALHDWQQKLKGGGEIDTEKTTKEQIEVSTNTR